MHDNVLSQPILSWDFPRFNSPSCGRVESARCDEHLCPWSDKSRWPLCSIQDLAVSLQTIEACCQESSFTPPNFFLTSSLSWKSCATRTDELRCRRNDMRSFKFKINNVITAMIIVSLVMLIFSRTKLIVANGTEVFLRSSSLPSSISKYRQQKWLWLFEGRYPCFKVRIEFRICDKKNFYMDCQLEYPVHDSGQGLVCVLSSRRAFGRFLMSKDRAGVPNPAAIWLYLTGFASF